MDKNISKILIVEDEKKLREELKTFLINNGYEVEIIENFEDTLEEMKKINCDLILLDINLPGTNGQYLCKEYRKDISTPIVIITSKNTEMDELISINYGADDFITKPFNLQILLARIERILQRINNIDTNIIKYKNLTLDIAKSVITTEKSNVELSKNELKIFQFLLKNKGKINSRDDLMDYLWNSKMYVDDNTLTVNINRLRNKLLDLGLENVIETRRGQGYIIL